MRLYLLLAFALVLSTPQAMADASTASVITVNNQPMVFEIGASSSTTVEAMRLTTNTLTVSGTVSATRFVGNGSGLTNLGLNGDRITSGTSSIIAVSSSGYISLTQNNTNTAWFNPQTGLVALGVSTTGPISATAAYFRGEAQVGSSGNSCTANAAGSLRYAGGNLSLCTSNTWAGINASTDGGMPTSCSEGQTITRTSTAWQCSCNGWTRLDNAGRAGWTGFAVSSDGSKMAAAAYGEPIKLSTDGGYTWTTTDSARSWQGLAMSDDGSVIAGIVYGGRIYVSTNGGSTFTARGPAGNQNWSHITMSSNGAKMAATIYSGNIYVSTNTGSSWTSRASSLWWQDIEMSDDGSILLAATTSSGLWGSINSGTNWSQLTTDTSVDFNGGVAMTSDGGKMMATDGTGAIWASEDGGSTWSKWDTSDYYDVAISHDSSKIAAMASSEGHGGAISWSYYFGTGDGSWYTTTSPAVATYKFDFYPGSHDKMIAWSLVMGYLWKTGCVNITL